VIHLEPLSPHGEARQDASAARSFSNIMNGWPLRKFEKSFKKWLTVDLEKPRLKFPAMRGTFIEKKTDMVFDN
jgi:hypothetical protein